LEEIQKITIPNNPIITTIIIAARITTINSNDRVKIVPIINKITIIQAVAEDNNMEARLTQGTTLNNRH